MINVLGRLGATDGTKPALTLKHGVGLRLCDAITKLEEIVPPTAVELLRMPCDSYVPTRLAVALPAIFGGAVPREFFETPRLAAVGTPLHPHRGFSKYSMAA
jgi:hypothetical protein